MPTASTAVKYRDISDITNALVGHFQITSLLNEVVNASMLTLNAEVCSIFLFTDNDPSVLTMMAGSGFAKALVGKASYRLGEGFTGTVAQYGSKFNIRSRQELENLVVDGKKVWEGKFDGEQWPLRESQFRNLLARPLKIKDSVLGVIKVENKKGSDCFTEEDERYFETMANVVALAIENARLHGRIKNQLKQAATMASHRISNQATNYDGVVRELLKQCDQVVPDKRQIKDLAKRLTDSTEGLKKISLEIQNFGRPVRVQRSSCDLHQIIQDERWYAKPPKGIEIHEDLNPEIPNVNIDPRLFADAIKELLRNSLKALSKERNRSEVGQIWISTNIQASKHRDMITITVRDNGPGFPQNFPIFEPFESTDPEHTGCGLAIVKEIVEAHGGTIIPQSSMGETGACLKITIPAF